MTLTLVIPFYNEAERLDTDEILDNTASPINWILVDDGSTDDTAAHLESVAQELVSKGKIAIVVSLPNNCGKGEAVRQGMLASREYESDYIGFLDADFSTPIIELVRLANEAKTRNAQIVLGARVGLYGLNIRRNAFRHYVGRISATLISSLLRIPIYDTQAGAKVFARPVIDALFDDQFASRWLFDCELILRALKQNFSIIEIPLNTWIENPAHSKVRPADYFKSLYDLVKIRWLYR